jgi:hypothetical protein
MKRLCSVYFFSNGVFVFSESLTTQGVAVVSGARYKLPGDPPPDMLGNAVLEALATSTEGIPFPKDHKLLTKEMVTFAGQRSWKEFFQVLLKAANVESDASNVVVTPNKKGARASLLPDLDASSRVQLDATAIGHRLLQMG